MGVMKLQLNNYKGKPLGENVVSPGIHLLTIYRPNLHEKNLI